MMGEIRHGAIAAQDELDLLEIEADVARNVYSGTRWAVVRRAHGGGFESITGLTTNEKASVAFGEHFKPVRPVNVFLVHESRLHAYGSVLRGEGQTDA